MRTAPIGRDGPAVGVVGFGAWGIGGETPGATSYGPTDDKVSLRALAAALDSGITFYDTAAAYGAGHSEELIGQAFARARARVVIATKAGCVAFGRPLDISPAAIRDSLAASLRRLRTDRIDLLQLHSPDPAAPGLDDAVAALDRLRADGKVRAYGVSLRAPEDGPALIDRYPGIAAVQVNLNLLDQRADDCGLLHKAAFKGVAVIARTPLAFGFLAGANATSFHPADHRSRWPAEQIAAWRDGARLFSDAIAKAEDQPLATVALRYCLSHAAVAVVIPGILTPDEARRNADVGDMAPLGPIALTRARALHGANRFMVARAPRPGGMGVG